VTPRSVAVGYRRFGGPCYHYLLILPWRERQQYLLKCWYILPQNTIWRHKSEDQDFEIFNIHHLNESMVNSTVSTENKGQSVSTSYKQQLNTERYIFLSEILYFGFCPQCIGWDTNYNCRGAHRSSSEVSFIIHFKYYIPLHNLGLYSLALYVYYSCNLSLSLRHMTT
jgi:hypothetical protein